MTQQIEGRCPINSIPVDFSWILAVAAEVSPYSLIAAFLLLDGVGPFLLFLYREGVKLISWLVPLGEDVQEGGGRCVRELMLLTEGCACELSLILNSGWAEGVRIGQDGGIVAGCRGVGGCWWLVLTEGGAWDELGWGSGGTG